MRKSAFRITLAVLLLLGASFAVSVSVSSPNTNSNVGTLVTISATASSSYPITGWHIYVDNTSVYQGGATQSIAPAITLATGIHQVVVRAWDSTGTYGSVNLSLTASAPPNPAVNVTLSSPAANATTSSPVNFSASASSGYPISGWHIYVDGVSSYSGAAGATLSAPVTMSAGTHQVVVRAWNAMGAYGDNTLTLTVPAAAAPVSSPTPPANAVKLANLEQSNSWQKCSSEACSGGIAPVSNYWVAPFQSTPSLNGASTGFFGEGPAYATDLFWLHVTPNDVPTHFIFDFNVYFDQSSYTAAQATEFDFFQVAGHLKYMFGSECNYWTQVWDIWNEATQQWIHSNAVCNKFQPNTWHHVVWSLERVGAQTHYLSITVDGNTQVINSSLAYQPAPSTGWAEGAMGIQVQQDMSCLPGNGFEEWLNEANVYLW
jgi:hypothetical protein